MLYRILSFQGVEDIYKCRYYRPHIVMNYFFFFSFFFFFFFEKGSLLVITGKLPDYELKIVVRGENIQRIVNVVVFSRLEDVMIKYP